jgi:hypothetical protein
MTARFFTPIALLLLAVGGCTAGGGVEDAGSMEAGAGSLGIVQVERFVGDDPLVVHPRAVLGAAFAQYRGVDGRAVVALLGGQPIDTEQCRVVGADLGGLDSVDDFAGGQVELFDVGELEVGVAGTRARMLPRTFPDLAGSVTGAFYAEDATLAVVQPEQDEYVIRGNGERAGFEVLLVAPPGLQDLLVDGDRAVDVTELTRGLDIAIRWEAGDPRDRIEVALQAAGVELQCAARDDGHFVVPGELTTWLDADEGAGFLLRRVRREPFEAMDFDAAWASVATTQELRVSLR